MTVQSRQIADPVEVVTVKVNWRDLENESGCCFGKNYKPSKVIVHKKDSNSGDY
jgi:hypothetical protein